MADAATAGDAEVAGEKPRAVSRRCARFAKTS